MSDTLSQQPGCEPLPRGHDPVPLLHAIAAYEAAASVTHFVDPIGRPLVLLSPTPDTLSVALTAEELVVLFGVYSHGATIAADAGNKAEWEVRTAKANQMLQLANLLSPERATGGADYALRRIVNERTENGEAIN